MVSLHISPSKSSFYRIRTTIFNWFCIVTIQIIGKWIGPLYSSSCVHGLSYSIETLTSHPFSIRWSIISAYLFPRVYMVHTGLVLWVNISLWLGKHRQGPSSVYLEINTCNPFRMVSILAGATSCFIIDYLCWQLAFPTLVDGWLEISVVRDCGWVCMPAHEM